MPEMIRFIIIWFKMKQKKSIRNSPQIKSGFIERNLRYFVMKLDQTFSKKEDYGISSETWKPLYWNHFELLKKENYGISSETWETLFWNHFELLKKENYGILSETWKSLFWDYFKLLKKENDGMSSETWNL